MNNPIDLDRILVKSDKPKNSLQLLFWLVLEPKLLKKYNHNLSYKQRTWALLKCYPYIILICTVGYLLSSSIIFYLEFPLLFPKEFEKNLMDAFAVEPSFLERYLFFTSHSFFTFITALGIGLILGLISYVSGKLVGGLVISLIFGLTGGLAIELAEGLINALLVGNLTGVIDETLTGIFSFGFAMGIAMGLIASTGMCVTVAFAFSFLFGITFMMAGGVLFGLAIGIIYGLIYGFGIYTSRFRILFQPFYCLFPINFVHSPYFYDALIRYPIWKAKQRFCLLATQDPESALKFIYFLRKYRPLQAELTDYIRYAAHASLWAKNSFKIEHSLTAPKIEKLIASSEWLAQLKKVNKQHINYQQASSSAKKEQLKQLSLSLDLFKLQSKMENKEWRDYYIVAIHQWQKAIKIEARNLKTETHPLNQQFITSLH
jgi:hypothetical protein